jgi:hypothetical protein
MSFNLNYDDSDSDDYGSDDRDSCINIHRVLDGTTQQHDNVIQFIKLLKMNDIEYNHPKKTGLYVKIASDELTSQIMLSI